jgi:hypothetical protein
MTGFEDEESFSRPEVMKDISASFLTVVANERLKKWAFLFWRIPIDPAIGEGEETGMPIDVADPESP